MSEKSLPELAQEIAAQRAMQGDARKRGRPMKRRDEKAARGHAWHYGLDRYTRRDPEQVKRELVEMGVETFARGVIAAMDGPVCPMCHRGGESWAFQTFAKVAGWVGAETNVVLAVFGQLGVANEQEARVLIDLAKSAQGKTPDDTARDALAYLTEHYRAQGKRVVVLEDATPKATEGPNGQA